MDIAPQIRWVSLWAYGGFVYSVVLTDTEGAVSAAVYYKAVFESQAPGGTWVSPTVYSDSSGVSPGVPLTRSVVLGVTSSSYELRARIQLLDAGLAVINSSDWFYVNWDSVTQSQVNVGRAPIVALPFGRSQSYKQVRDALINRRGIQSPNAAELERIAQFITAANRQSLQGYTFGEQWNTLEVTCDNGKVLWADIYGADHREFFTADPRPANDCARCITEKQPDADGVWLDSGIATTVWAKFVPRFPEFTNVALVDATSYGQGAIGFVDATGHCYECIAVTGALGSEYADTSKWRPLPLLWIIKEPIIGFAESLLAERSQQYGSAASIHARAMDTLGTLQTKDLEKYQTR